jgi:hypothetical protein
VNKSTHNGTINFLIGTGIAGAIAVWNLFRWMHHTSLNARFNTILWAAFFVVSLLSGLARILYFRNHRDYFAEEMDHRRSLAKGR